MLFKFKKIESPLCYFCENDIETIQHFLFLCPRVQVFWSEVCSTFGEKLNWSRSLHIKDIFFGNQDLKIHVAWGHVACSGEGRRLFPSSVLSLFFSLMNAVLAKLG